MVGSKKKVPKYTKSHLSDELRRTWTGHDLSQKLADVWRKFGPLRDFSEMRVGKDKLHDIDFHEGKVFVSLYGAKQLIYFEQEGKEEEGLRFTLCVHNIGVNSSEEKEVRSFVEGRFTNSPADMKRKLEKLFGERTYKSEEVTFRSEKYGGVIVKASIKELPLGRGSHLSADLYELAYNGIVLPAHRVLVGGSEVSKEVWYNFNFKESEWKKLTDKKE